MYDGQNSRSQYSNVSDISIIEKSHTLFNDKIYELGNDVDEIRFLNNKSIINTNGFGINPTSTSDYPLIFQYGKYDTNFIGLSGFEISGTKNGIKIWGSHYSIIENIKMLNIDGIGIFNQGSTKVLFKNISMINVTEGVNLGNGADECIYEDFYFEGISDYSFNIRNQDNNIFRYNVINSSSAKISFSSGGDNNKFYLNKFYFNSSSIINLALTNKFYHDIGGGVYLGNYWFDSNSCTNESNHENLTYLGIDYTVCRSNYYVVENAEDRGVLLPYLSSEVISNTSSESEESNTTSETLNFNTSYQRFNSFPTLNNYSLILAYFIVFVWIFV